MSRPTVLVLGANGRFGQAAVHAFAAAGWRVLAQLRRAPAAPLPAGAEALTLPLADTDGPGRGRGRRTRRRLRREPRLHALDAGADAAGAAGHGRRRTLGAAVHAARQRLQLRLAHAGAVARRHAAAARQSTRASSASHWKTCWPSARPQGHRSVVIRAGDFYGCGAGSWLDQLIAKSIGTGQLVYPGPLDVPHAWAYLPDLARAFVAVASQADAPAFQRLHFAGHTLTGAEMVAALERAGASLGLQPAQGWRHGRWHWPLVALAGLVWPTGRELARMSYLWRVPHALDGSALAQAVGPLSTTPVDAALTQALRDLGHGAVALPRPHAA